MADFEVGQDSCGWLLLTTFGWLDGVLCDWLFWLHDLALVDWALATVVNWVLQLDVTLPVRVQPLRLALFSQFRCLATAKRQLGTKLLAVRVARRLFYHVLLDYVDLAFIYVVHCYFDRSRVVLIAEVTTLYRHKTPCRLNLSRNGPNTTSLGHVSGSELSVLIMTFPLACVRVPEFQLQVELLRLQYERRHYVVNRIASIAKWLDGTACSYWLSEIVLIFWEELFWKVDYSVMSREILI